MTKSLKSLSPFYRRHGTSLRTKRLNEKTYTSKEGFKIQITVVLIDHLGLFRLLVTIGGRPSIYVRVGHSLLPRNFSLYGLSSISSWNF